MKFLLKAAIQAIPTFTMGRFKLLLGLFNDIEVMIKKNSFGANMETGGKFTSYKWDELTKSKIVGGMGFCDLALFNGFLLAKQSWRFLENRNSLFYKVFKAHFLPKCLILKAKDSSSYAGKSILKGQDVLLRGSQRQIGDGKFVKIWQNHWMPRKHPPLMLSPTVPSMEDATVDILIEAEKRQWSHDLIDGIFAPKEAKLIKKIPLE